MGMRAGDAWDVVHCDCMWTGTAGCGGDDDDRLLWGYASYRNAGDGSVVPVAPAQCCKACIGARVHKFDACEALHHCHGHGVCVRTPLPPPALLCLRTQCPCVPTCR